MLSHVALHAWYNFWKEYILRILRTPPFKNLKSTEFHNSVVMESSGMMCRIHSVAKVVTTILGGTL